MNDPIDLIARLGVVPARNAAAVRAGSGGKRVTAYEPATRPTLYFIGVTTGKSSIMKVFPAWARFLGAGGRGRHAAAGHRAAARQWPQGGSVHQWRGWKL
ncbi:hypothetical protein MESS2_730230 [Mesorhizobium metallidurans STM 2683]|uniref:Uncharacterized protein n=1 Tax=Mesorhizobium metallidurans STM 2683 TaxID=1297569 RepID=M5ETN5_9HYPH|nr:hypothetical protein MESS2_730230 [Mesorhizobium metallidurans STM 2683]